MRMLQSGVGGDGMCKAGDGCWAMWRKAGLALSPHTEGELRENGRKINAKSPPVMDENGVRGRVVDMEDERGRKDVKGDRRGVSNGTYRM